MNGYRSFTGTLRGPLFTGVSSSVEVPDIYPIGLDGRGYMLDWSSKAFSHDTIPLLKPYFLTDGDTNERTLNPEAGWRRSQVDWSHGAGQLHFDNDNSDRTQYFSSKGVDPWTQWQLKLLPDVDQILQSAHTNLELVTAGVFLYTVDGAGLKWKDIGDLTWSDSGATGTPTSVCSDGFNIYVALPTGVGLTVAGSSATTLGWSQLVPDVIAFCNGRLVAAQGQSIFNIIAGKVATPTSLAAVVNGTPGTTHWAYQVTATNAVGETLPCAELVVTTGNATLSPTNNIALTWDPMQGAVNYNVYGRTSGGELKMSTVTMPAFTDDGTVVTPVGALPTADTTSAAPAALFTHPNPDWTWVGFAEGQACIYVAGYSGDRSQVYRIGINSDGTTLSAPIACLPGMPLGEVVSCISTYLGPVILGTSLGIRQTADPDSNGNLQLGARIDTLNPVRCASGADRFVYFGLENYDPTSTGLGRLDMQNATSAGVSAWASDLMAPAQGQVASVVTWNGQRVFAVNGAGIYAQAGTLVPSGWLRQGLMTYNIPDPKIAFWADVRRLEPLVGSFQVELDADDGGFVSLGTQTDEGHTVIFAGRSIHGETFESRLTLIASSDDPTLGPILRRFTLVSLPSAQSGQTFTVPVMMASPEGPQGQSLAAMRSRDIDDEITFLENLRAQKRVVTYQEFSRTYTVTLEDFKLVPLQPSQNGRHIGNLTCVLTLKTIDTPSAS